MKVRSCDSYSSINNFFFFISFCLQTVIIIHFLVVIFSVFLCLKLSIALSICLRWDICAPICRSVCLAFSFLLYHSLSFSISSHPPYPTFYLPLFPSLPTPTFLSLALPFLSPPLSILSLSLSLSLLCPLFSLSL